MAQILVTSLRERKLRSLQAEQSCAVMRPDWPSPWPDVTGCQVDPCSAGAIGSAHQWHPSPIIFAVGWRVALKAIESAHQCHLLAVTDSGHWWVTDSTDGQ